MSDTTSGSAFPEARRMLSGLTAGAERRTLRWIAERVPGPVTSDHLTLLGFASMLLAGAFYAGSARHPWLLLAVNAALVLNWLGDSLDGTLARHRGCERPRFGFYVDHLADAFGALFVLAGLGLSGRMSPMVAAVVLVAYFLLAIETYLATYALRCFKLSWGPFGGTELRLIVMLLNVFVLFRPVVELGGARWRAMDIAGILAAAVLAVMVVVAGVRGTRALVREEGWAPAAPRRLGA